MKKWTAAALMAMVIIGSTAGVLAAIKPTKPEKGVIVGEVIELSTFAMKGHGSKEIIAGAKNRVGQGFPVAILEDKTGDIFVAVYKNNAPASAMVMANKILEPYVGQKVVATGQIYRAKGMNLMQIRFVSEY